MTGYLTIVASALLALAAGCGKQTESGTRPPEAGIVQTQAPAAAPSAKEPAAPAVTNAPPQAETARTVVTNPTLANPAVTNVAVKGQATAQEIIEAAQRLVAEKKWQELAQTLGKLQGQSLTPDQEKALLGLKEQLETMVRDALGK
jgi:hypothetical protein